jgi:hypothetical protein
LRDISEVFLQREIALHDCSSRWSRVAEKNVANFLSSNQPKFTNQRLTAAATSNAMSDDGDHGDMEDAGHSSIDFFDHDPCKREKIEVR